VPTLTVYQFCRALGLQRFVYTGSSHGGVIRWHLAVEHPEILEGIVAVAGVPHARGHESGRTTQLSARTEPVASSTFNTRLRGCWR
jgi:pimeloyl-ACP methyl ester carboxylesterase